MLNRKGSVELLSLFTIVALLATIYSLGMIYTREPVIKDVKVGENVLKILDQQNKVQKNLFFIDASAEYAINEPLLQLGLNGGFNGEDCRRGDFYLWSKTCKPENVGSNFLDIYEGRFLKYIGEYNGDLATDYNFLLDKNKLILWSNKNIVFGNYDEPSANYNENFFRENNEYNKYIIEAASTYGIDEALIKAVIKKESSFDPNARSKKGAYGLMQIKEDAYKDVKKKCSNEWISKCSVDWTFNQAKKDPRYNILTGSGYLAIMIERYKGKGLDFALAAYNAGPTPKWDCDKSTKDERCPIAKYGIPPSQETTDYITKVNSDYNYFSKGNPILSAEGERGIRVTQIASIYSKADFNYNFKDYEDIYLLVETCAIQEDFTDCAFESFKSSNYKWSISGGKDLKLIEVITDKKVNVVESGSLVEKPIVIKALVDVDSFKSA